MNLYENQTEVVKVTKMFGAVIAETGEETLPLYVPRRLGTRFYETAKDGFFRAILRFDGQWEINWNDPIEPLYQFLNTPGGISLRVVPPIGEPKIYGPFEGWPELPEEHKVFENNHNKNLAKRGIVTHLREIVKLAAAHFEELK